MIIPGSCAYYSPKLKDTYYSQIIPGIICQSLLRGLASLVKGGLLYRYMPSPFYPSSVGGMVSHMQELGTH